MKNCALALALTLLVGCAPQAKPKDASRTPSSTVADAGEIAATEAVTPETFLDILGPDAEKFKKAVQQLEQQWDDGLAVVVLETMTLSPRARGRQLFDLLSRMTKQNHKTVNDWFAWYWNQQKRPPAWYPEFKAKLYSRIDPSFARYFQGRLAENSDIDLTEVRWGGVVRDGIPPLDHPKMLKAAEATYLTDSDVVFGIVNKGDARAYPKRILAWHEMFRDEIGGDSIAGVYCTLCGTVIPYLSEGYTIGTSGFLYRSNKVMYDLKTRSMWSTFEGEPVFGPLRGKGIKFDTIPVVTTTWGEWKKRFPTTTVLSLDTGHRRDYGEGVAYKAYFGSDELMFNIPQVDTRLKNKDEVLIVRVPGPPLAMAAKFLLNNRVYEDKKGDTKFVVLTDDTGANRVFERGEQKFSNYSNNQVLDGSGSPWEVTPDALIGPGSQKLKRLPAHRAFWFGWFSVHNDTRLVK